MDLLLLGTLIAGFTTVFKELIPRIRGWITMLVAVLVGLILAVVDTQIELPDFSLWEGFLTAIATIGVIYTIKKRVY